MAGEQLLRELTFVLRLGDSDRLERREDQVTGKVYGGRFHEGVDDGDNWIARLKRTLGRRRFQFNKDWYDLDLDEQHRFDSETEWAVREFQIAAGYPKALKDDGTQIDMPAGARYTGPISGVLNAETLSALKFWDAQTPPLICQIELSGFEKVVTDETTGDPSHPNLWRDDEVKKSVRVFALDRSGQFFRPGPTLPLPVPPRDPAKYQVTGGVEKYGGIFGPVTDAKYSWKRASDESEVLPERLFDLKSGSILDRQLATFRIIRAAADVECFGFFEGGNAFDDQVVSFGLAHWTIRPDTKDTEGKKVNHGGEFPAFLAYFQQRYPTEFEQAISQFGLYTSRVWPRLGGSADGHSLFKGGKYDCQSSLDTEADEAVVMPGAFDEMRYLRNWHWLYRFIMAGRGEDAYRRAMWDMARIRLRIILDANWPTGDDWPQLGARPAKLGETFRSEQSLAMLVRWHVYRPGHVRSGDTVGSKIQDVYRAVRSLPPFSNDHNVANWNSRHESHLAEQIIKQFDETFNKNKKVTDDGFNHTLRQAGQWLDASLEHDRNYLVSSRLPRAVLTFSIPGGSPADQSLGSLPIPQAGGVTWSFLSAGNPGTSSIFIEFQNAGLPLIGDGARVARINGSSPEAWYVENREAPQDGDNGTLIRRFELIRKDGNSASAIHVRELLNEFTIFASESAATQLPGTKPKQGAVQWLLLLPPLNATVVLFQRFADENIVLTTNGARIGRLPPRASEHRHWYLEDREEPADNNEDGALLRRFHLERLPSQDIRVRELPVVSQRRDERDPDADQMFEMDLTGLPRLKYKHDNAGEAMIQYEIASAGGLTPLGTVLAEGLNSLSDSALTEFKSPLVKRLSLTDTGLVDPATITAVETGGPGRDRWLVRTTNLNLPFFTIRRVSATHVNADWPGESLRYGGEQLNFGMSSANVKSLRRDLVVLGIDPKLLDDAVQVDFDEHVRTAVRAFQSYARREFVAKETSANTSSRWVQRLTQQRVEHPLRYHGIVNGIVDLETRSLIDHWIAEKWRCPVVIDARTLPAGANNSIVSGKDNLWRFDEHTDPNHFFFVTDFSVPPPVNAPTNTPPQTQPLAVYRNGPAVQNFGGYAPAKQEITVATMTPGSLPKTERMTSTVKILRAVAGQLPCRGFLDGVNAADEQRVANIGAMNLHESRATGDTSAELRGRLGALMSLSRSVERRAFGQGFGRDRIRSSANWETKAKDILTNDPHSRLLTPVARQNDSTNASTYDEIISVAHVPEWRGWHSVYRLVSVARLEGTGRAYYDIARLELLALGSLPIDLPHRLQNIVTSERAWAMLGLWHAKHPNDVSQFANPVSQKKRVPAQPLSDVIEAVKAKGYALPFSTKAAQEAVVQAIVTVVTNRYSAPVVNPDPDFVTAIRNLSQDNTLGDTQGSWKLDKDHLPHFNFKTGLFTALLNPSKTPSNTLGLARVGSTSKTTTSLGFYGTADIENNKFHATHSAFSIADSDGNLRTLICPLLTEREMDLELNEPEDFTTTVYRSPGQQEESLAVIRCKATNSNKEQLKGDGDKWGFDPAAMLGTPDIPITAGFQFADLDFDADGFLTGKISADFDFQLPFGDPLPVSLGGVGNSGEVTFSEFSLDEDNGSISAPTQGLLKSLANFLALPDDIEFDFTGAIDGDRFALNFATPRLNKLAMDLVPTLVSFDMENVRLSLDTRTGFGIDLAQGIDRAKVGLASDLFANAGADAVINHACESIADEDFGKLFKLLPDDANGILMDAGARLVSWDGRFPQLSSILLGGLTKLEVNAARRLRSFAGELLGGLAERCHSKFDEAVGKSIRYGRDSEQGIWFVEVPLQMIFNDEVNQGSKSESADERDFLKLTGWFRFTCSGDDDFVRFGAGSFCVDPKVVLEVEDPNSYKGRAFGKLVSLHIPNKSVFVFNTDPTQASIRWDVERSRAKQAEPDPDNPNAPVKPFQNILIRVPASDCDKEPEKMSEPEAKRFTFEMNDFGLGVAGLDLAGQIRVESVTMNEPVAENDPDREKKILDEEGKTGLKAPLSIEKADSRPKDAGDDTPVVGEIRFTKSRLVFGSLKAGFQLRFFDNATGTIAFAMAEDLETKKLSVTGTVEINTPVEYRLDELYSTFQLKSVRLSTTCTIDDDKKISWTSDGAIAGAVKFLPPAGESADGPLAALSDFFSGVTCEFEDLNPVKLGRGASFTFNFPPKTFNLANVMEVDLNGITVGDNSKLGNKNRFGLLGDVRLKDLPGVGGTLTFGGIDLTATDGLPELDIKRIGAALTLPGGIGIEAEFERIKNEQESGFAGLMTLKSESLPNISGLLKLTEVRCLNENRTVPSLALYMGANIDAPLVFGFYLRGLGMGLGIYQGLRGLRAADSNGKSITQRVMAFVDDPKGIPDPGTIEAWQPDAPDTVRSRLNWMLVAQALITYGKFPPNKPHVITGTLIGALDQDLTLTLGTNIWLFASPEEITKPDFKPRPVARGAMQISPREGKVFAYFRTLPNPKLGSTAPELVTKVLAVVQPSCMFLADGNGFLTEVGWPWETKVDAAKIGIPSPLRGELSAGFRFGIYRGVVTYGLNFGIDVQMKADVGLDFDTPLGSAGAHLSVNGSGMFRASFIGAIDPAMRPYLLGDVRVAAQVAVRVEAHCELSRKITRWFKIRLRIRFRESFNLSITAALAAAMDSDGLGFSGDAHVAVSVSRYRISGRVPFQFNPNRVGSVRSRLDEILPKPIVTEGNKAFALGFSPDSIAAEGFALAAAEALESTEWNYRIRQLPLPGNRVRVLVALMPAPGVKYPKLDNADTPPSDRFTLKLKDKGPTAFKGFLLGGPQPLEGDVLKWHEDCGEVLMSVDGIRREYEQLDERAPDQAIPEPLTVGKFLFGVGNADQPESTFNGQPEVVDPRTQNPSPTDADDETVGIAPDDYRSPNFGRNTEYDKQVATACSRQGEIQQGKSAAQAIPKDNEDEEGIDGPSASMFAVEVLDLFGNDNVAARQAPTLRENIPADLFLAQYLRSVMVFDLDASDGDVAIDELLDPNEFFIHKTDGLEKVPLKNGIPDDVGEFDLIVGHHFQSREMIGLCWDLRLEKKPDDPFAAYDAGFEYFRVTRTNVTRRTVKERVETITPCWLDPNKGNPYSKATVLVRPQFQFVDQELGDPSDPNGDFREGDILSYRVEAIGPGVKRPTVCVFGIVRQTVRPLLPPVVAQALHQPRIGAADGDGMITDNGFIELSLVSPGNNKSEPRIDIPAKEVRVRYRLVPASSIGSYGFDSPVSATTRTEPGLSANASEGLGVQTIRFSASPQSRPLPWEETKELALSSTLEWGEFKLQADDNQPDRPDEEKFQTVLRLKTALKVTDVWRQIEKDHPDELLHGKAVEFWIGREKERLSDSPDVNSPNGQDSLVESLPVQRSVLVLCRHAVVLPNVASAPIVAAIAGTISKDYFTAGTTVAAIERMPSRAEKPTDESRYLPPNMMRVELRGTPVPLGYDPSTPPTINDPENAAKEIPNPAFVANDVRLALTWRMPPEPNTQPFDPVIAFRQYRVDRFNPVLHRIRGKSLEQRLERTVQVIPDQLYRSTPDLIEVLPITESGNGTTPTYRGDWRTRQPADAHDILQDGWGKHPLPKCSTIHPFTDDPDRAGSTFLHSDLVFFAEKFAEAIANAIAKANGTQNAVRPLWRVREPFEDRADLQAAQDGLLNNASDEEANARLAAREARFKAAFETFAAGHEANSDPYGWRTAEAFGLSSEILFVQKSSNEPVNLDQLVRRGALRTKLQEVSWDMTFDNDGATQQRRPPVVVLWFHADDGVTLLNVVRLLYVGDLPGWDDSQADGFNLRLASGLKFLGVDPALRNDKNDPDKWKSDYQFIHAGPQVFDWLNRNYSDRLRKGLEVPTDKKPSIRSGQILIYDRTLSAPATAGGNPLAGALPIQEDGTVQLYLPVQDRLAHVFDIALEPCRRYDALWEQLMVKDAKLPQPIPFSCLFPVKVDRTRPLVPHNLIATPLQGAVQAYVFAHPAEFAACASAINAAAIEYSGHTVYLQRRIPELTRIEEILENREALDVNWGLYRKWLNDKNYEQVEPASDEIARGREILLTPPPDDLPGPPISWNAMRTLPVTQVGIYGADRYVIPDVPAYYEYRFAAFSTAGTAQSPLAHTPFVKPLFDDVIQPVSSEGRMIARVSVVNDPDSPLDKETILELEIVLGHPRLHLRPEMRGLWVGSDDTFVCPQAEGESVVHRFGSLPDFELEYVLLFNSNFPNAFRVLNPLVSLIPPLDPQRKKDDSGRFSPFFLAKSPDDSCAQVVGTDGLPHREAEVKYVQNSLDGSIRVKLELIIGKQSGAGPDDTPKSRTLRELLRQARIPDGQIEIKPELFSFIVRRNGVQSRSPIIAISPKEVIP